MEMFLREDHEARLLKTGSQAWQDSAGEARRSPVDLGKNLENHAYVRLYKLYIGYYRL